MATSEHVQEMYGLLESSGVVLCCDGIHLQDSKSFPLATKRGQQQFFLEQ